MRAVLKTTLLSIFFGLNQIAFGQEVEHNFEMKPQTTNCDSLDLNELEEKVKIEWIELAKFRFTQDIKLNRIKGFQAAWFYSCDNKNGYLIAKIDNQKSLYENVPLGTWYELIASSDFLLFIQDNLDNQSQ